MCGIFGIITPKPRKLDLRAFCVLGVNNDSRGGDSCGIFIDRKYEYGVNEQKLFYNFFPRSKVLRSTTKCQVALGHCRKASIGAINEANAQPVVIKDANGKVQFALIHNGTIPSYLALANKYIPNIDVKGMTDSQVMAHIFYHTGYDVLGEYIGAGAFVMVDYRSGEPEVFFFKGESKLNQRSVTTQVERPLFCSYSTTEFIFSSIMDYLKALRPGREVFTIPANKLTMLKGGKLTTIKEYDRSELYQTVSNYNYGRVNDYFDTPYVCTYVQEKKGTENIFSQGSFNDKYHWDDVIDMDETGVYLVGTARAHGTYFVDAMGNIEKNKVTGTFQATFWKGVLLKNAACFTFLSKCAKEMGCSHDELLVAMPDLVHFLSPCVCWRNQRGQWVTSDSPTTQYLYTGVAVFPFTTEELEFSMGRLDTYIEGIPYREALNDLLASSDYKIDYHAIRKLL